MVAFPHFIICHYPSNSPKGPSCGTAHAQGPWCVCAWCACASWCACCEGCGWSWPWPGLTLGWRWGVADSQAALDNPTGMGKTIMENLENPEVLTVLMVQKWENPIKTRHLRSIEPLLKYSKQFWNYKKQLLNHRKLIQAVNAKKAGIRWNSSNSILATKIYDMVNNSFGVKPCGAP